MKFLDDELMEDISGGYNVDDLSPEDLAELERLGGIMIELQIMKRNNDPGYSKDKYVEIATQLSELDRKFIEKYGR